MIPEINNPKMQTMLWLLSMYVFTSSTTILFQPIYREEKNIKKIELEQNNNNNNNNNVDKDNNFVAIVSRLTTWKFIMGWKMAEAIDSFPKN